MPPGWMPRAVAPPAPTYNLHAYMEAFKRMTCHRESFRIRRNYSCYLPTTYNSRYVALSSLPRRCPSPSSKLQQQQQSPSCSNSRPAASVTPASIRSTASAVPITASESDDDLPDSACITPVMFYGWTSPIQRILLTLHWRWMLQAKCVRSLGHSTQSWSLCRALHKWLWNGHKPIYTSIRWDVCEENRYSEFSWLTVMMIAFLQIIQVGLLTIKHSSI